MSRRSAVSRSVLLVGGSVVLSACAQLLMKAGMLELHGMALAPGLSSPEFVQVLLWVGAGLASYAVSLLFWMGALARLELSLAYPVLSLAYVLVYIGAVLWPRLGESLSGPKTAGIVLIVIGVILVTRTGGHGTGSDGGPTRQPRACSKGGQGLASLAQTNYTK